jgi:hypothetical protein
MVGPDQEMPQLRLYNVTTNRRQFSPGLRKDVISKELSITTDIRHCALLEAILYIVK